MPDSKRPYHILIVSANPLFREGILAHYRLHWQEKAEVVGVYESLQHVAFKTLLQMHPELILLDQDTPTLETEIHRVLEEANWSLRVVVLSLRDADRVVVYNRQVISGGHLARWLDAPWQNIPNSQENDQ